MSRDYCFAVSFLCKMNNAPLTKTLDTCSVLQNLRLRFNAGQCFTRVGNILISLNPFDWNDTLYSSELADAYLDPIKPETSGHFFQIAARAFKGATEAGRPPRPQSIIISGESGSGKTEATKKCLQLLTYASRGKLSDSGSFHSSSTLNDKLLAANPLLESFGNAKTVRNDNSSRFGKWTQVSVCAQSGEIATAELLQFLLEKSRAFTRSSRERNFHIFYQLLSHASQAPALRESLKLPAVLPSFRILHSANASAANDILPSDLEGFNDVKRSLEVLEIAEAVQAELWRLLGGILWLGNVEFEEDEDDSERCVLASEEPLEIAAELLGVTGAALAHALTHHSRVIGGSKIDSPLLFSQANDAIAATVKEVYAWLFKWLVDSVNAALLGEKEKSVAAVAVGVLDIFGFEIFDENSMEQLCINYANERLQKQFTDTTFAQEEALYKHERIDYQPCTYTDNVELLEIIHGRPAGILVLLDEECRLPKGSDEQLAAKIRKEHARSRTQGRAGLAASSSSSAWVTCRPADARNFIVHHYAGQVEYTVDGWVEKNKSELRQSLKEVLCTSSVGVLASAAGMTLDQGRPRSGFRSQVGPFLTQLAQLMDTIDASDAHYIRCVKPNAARQKMRFESPMCLHQLRCSGIFDAIAIRKQGFPFRRSHQEFFNTYRFLVPATTLKAWRRTHAAQDFRSLASLLVDELGRPDVRVGTSKVLYKAEDHLFLRSQLMRVKTEAVMKLNRVLRGFIVRAQLAAAKDAIEQVDLAASSRDLVSLQRTTAHAQATIPPCFHQHHARIRQAHQVGIFEGFAICGLTFIQTIALLEEEQELLAALARDWDFVEDYTQAKAVFDRATALDLPRHHPSSTRLMQSFGQNLGEAERIALARTALRSATAQVDPEAIAAALLELEEVDPEADTSSARSVLSQWEQEQTWVVPLQAALATGDLDSEQLQIDALRAALRDAAPQTPRGHALKDYSSGVLALRTAVLAKEWEHLENALGVLDAMHSRGDLRQFKLPERVISLYRKHLHRVSIIQEVTAALQRGTVSGTVGALKLDTVDVQQLETELADARALGCEEADAVAVITLGRAVLAGRKAVLAADWPQAAALPHIAGNDELALIRAEGADRELLAAAEHAVKAAEGDENPSAFLDAATALHGREGAAAPTRQALERVKLLERIARAEAADVKDVLPVLEAEKEAWIARTTAGRLLRAQVLEAVGDGGARGAPGAVQVSHGAVTRAEEALVICERLAAVGAAAAASQPLRTLQRVAEVRRAVWKEEWEAAGAAVETALAEDLLEAAKEELCVVQAEVLERKAAARLCAALAARQVGTAEEDASELRAAVEASRDAQSSRVKLLVKSADVVAGLRGAEHKAAGKVLEEARFVRLVPEAQEEVALAQRLWEEEDVRRALVAALEAGRFCGEIEAIKTDDVELRALDAAIAKATRVQLRSENVKQLLRLARLVRKLRECVSEGRWAHLGALVDDARRQGFFELSHALPELELAQFKVEDERVKQDLAKALSQGAVHGTVGALALDDVKLGPLLETVSAVEAGEQLRTPGAKRLLASAKHIARLREAVFAGPDWAAVAAELDNADEEVAAEARAEHELLAAELADRQLLEELEAAIADGRVGGEVGELDLSHVSVEALEAQLRREAQLTLVTSRCNEAWGVIAPLRALRTALLAEDIDWENRVQECLAALDEQPVPRVAEAEVKLVRQEAENQVAQRRLVRAIQGAEDMQRALQAARSVVARTVKLNLLVTTSELVDKLRANAAAEPRDWDALQTLLKRHHVQVLPGSPVGEHVQPSDLARVAPAGHAPVQAALDALRDHICGERLSQGLEEGACMGAVGELNLSAIFTNSLEDALQLAARCERRLFAPTARLLCVARATLALRQGVKSEEPEATMQALADALPPLLDGWKHPAGSALLAEAELVAEEARNRALVSSLHEAVGCGAMRGSDPDSPELDALDRALHADKTRPPLSAQAAELVSAARLLLEVRRSLKRRDSERLKELLVDAAGMPVGAGEVARARRWVANEELRQALREVLQEGGANSLSVDVDAIQTQPLESVIDKAPLDLLEKDTMAELEACRYLCALRRLLKTSKYSDWDTVKRQADDLLAQATGVQLIEEETHTIATYIQMQLAASRLRDAMHTQASQQELEAALKAVEPFAAHLGRLFHSGQTILVLRQRMADGAWADVRAIATQALARGGEGLEEVRSMQQEAERRLVEQELSAAVGSGGVRGEVGDLDLSGVTVGGLNKAINLALTLGCRTKEAKRLLHSCNLLRQLRNGVLTGMGDLGSAQVRDLLSASSTDGEALVPEAARELALVQHHVQDSDALALLRRGLQSGPARGAVGAIDRAAVRTEELESALAFLREHPDWCRSLYAKALHKLAQLIVDLRRAVVDEDWARLARALASLDALRHTVDGPGVVSTQTRVHKASARALAAVEEEVMCARAEMDNAQALRALREAHTQGAVSGAPGALNTAAVSIAALDDAILLATKAGVRTADCRRALASAKALRALRRAVQEADLRTAGVVLAEPTLEASAEVELVAAHVANRSLMDRLQAAVSADGCEELAAALDAAKQVAPITDEARWLVVSCEAVWKVRSIHAAAMGPESWDKAQHVMEAAQRQVEVSTSTVRSTVELGWVHPTARAALALALEVVQRESAQAQLAAALGSGQACCMGGFVDASTVKTGALAKAVKLAEGLRLGSLVRSAETVLAARRGLLGGSWEQVKAALERAGELDERCRDEVEQLRREVTLHDDIKRVLVQLMEASQARDVAGLTHALKSADDLGMHRSVDEHIVQRVKAARAVLAKLVELGHRLEATMATSDACQLNACIRECEQVGFQPASLDKAKHVRDRLITLVDQARRAVAEVDANKMEEVLAACEELGIACPYAEEIKRVLGLPTHVQRMERLKAAVDRGDFDTAADVTFLIKSEFFQSEETRMRFAVENYANLRSTDELLSSIHDDTALGLGLQLEHSDAVISTSLTRISSPKAVSLAVKSFRALLGYMGDRICTYPLTLAQELVQVGLRVEEMRDELLLQVVKQLTNNPGLESEERGWALLKVYLSAFQPSEAFENHMELWLRRKQVELGKQFPYPIDCLKRMHQTICRGPQHDTSMPPFDDINILLGITPTMKPLIEE